MATKNIVPRANAQGQLGTDAKKWLKHIAVTGSFTAISGSISGNELTLVSGSVTSTGSFGRVVATTFSGEGSGITGVTATAAAGTVSSSAQIATQISGSLGANASIIRGLTNAGISGSFTDASSSLASRISTNEGYLNQSVKTTASPTFAGLTTTGDITARNYIVSSSVTYMTSSFSSGSTIFGDDSGDTHKFTGSLSVTGSFKVASGNAEFVGNVSGSATSTGSFGHIIKGGINWDTAVSKSAASAGFGTGGGGSSFTAAGISGSWQSYTLVSSSAQIATQISGSLGTNASVIRGLTNAGISGSWQSQNFISGSQVTSNLPTNTLSSSAQIATSISGSLGVNASIIRGLTNAGISGSFTDVSSSLAGRITTRELFTTQSFSDGTATKISGSVVSTGSFGLLKVIGNSDIDGKLSLGNFSDVSASLAAAVAGGDNLGNHTATQDLNLGSYDIYNVTHITASGNISSSITSTGSFGHIIKGGINWDTAVSSSAAAAGFGTGGGGSSFTAAGISGSWQSYTLVSSSAQIATQISGSLGANASVIRGLTNARISGSWQSQNFISGSQVTSNLPTNTLSSSAQIATSISGSLGANASIIRGLTNARISGSFTDASSSLASRVTTNEGYLNQSVKTTASPTFAGLTTTGDITARNYIVSSSVTYMTQSFSSGSTIFGDDISDTHKFTGSLFVSGSITTVAGVESSISASYSITASHALNSGASSYTSLTNIPSNIVSASAQLATQISGSLGTNASVIRGLTNARISGSLGTNASVIRGLTNARISGSLGTNASVIRGLTNARISGSFTTVSSSLAGRITTNKGLVSGSLGANASVIRGLTNARISGSLGTNASVIRGLTNARISGSWQGATTATASFGQLSLAGGLIDLKNIGDQSVIRLYCESSNAHYAQIQAPAHSAFSGNVTLTLPATAGTLALTQVGLISGSAQIATQISGSLGTNASVIRGLTNARISGSLGPNASIIRGLTNARISGSFTDMSSSFSTRVKANEDIVKGKTILSQSAQIATQISGSFGNQRVGTTDDVTFASLTTTGDITARNYIVSSSVTYMTSSFSSGSTIFGDDISDTHKFTGSLFVSGSITTLDNVLNTFSASYAITASHAINSGVTAYSSLTGVPANIISSSAQIKDEISGSFTSLSSSLASRLTAEEAEAEGSVISSSAQIKTEISGAFTSTSSSLASRVTSNESIVKGKTILSQSAQIKTEISGAFTSTSSSLASRITEFKDGTVTLVSGSSTSTGSFGHIMKGGVNWDTAVSASAAAGGFGPTGQATSGLTSTGISGSFKGWASGSYFSASVAAHGFGAGGGSTSTVSISSDGAFVFTQSLSLDGASATWEVTHSLNSQYANVTVYDTNDEVVIPSSITADGVDTATITFNSASAGKAIFSTGGILSGSVSSTGSFGRVEVVGDIIPKADNVSNLGSSTNRFANIYSADLELSNEGVGGNEIDGTEGSWTIQEGKDNLYLLSRTTNKKYKFVLQEIKD